MHIFKWLSGYYLISAHYLKTKDLGLSSIVVAQQSVKPCTEVGKQDTPLTCSYATQLTPKQITPRGRWKLKHGKEA